jgi:hypothetical protein
MGEGNAALTVKEARAANAAKKYKRVEGIAE